MKGYSGSFLKKMPVSGSATKSNTSKKSKAIEVLSAVANPTGYASKKIASAVSKTPAARAVGKAIGGAIKSSASPFKKHTRGKSGY